MAGEWLSLVPSRSSAGFSVPGYFGRMGIHALTLGTAFPTLLVPRVTQPLSLAPAPPGRPCGQESRGHWPEARGMGRPDTWIPDGLSSPPQTTFHPSSPPAFGLLSFVLLLEKPETLQQGVAYLDRVQMEQRGEGEQTGREACLCWRALLCPELAFPPQC